MPKISVIVPIYGVEKYICKCINSICNQTLKDIEIILIDDGGKDNCPNIIDEFARKDERIRVIHKTNKGYGHSCNTGLTIATGDYIAIVEPDDFIDCSMYEDLLRVAEQSSSDIVKSSYYENIETPELCVCRKIHWENNILSYSTYFTIKEFPQFLSCHPSIWSCIYRRKFLEQNKIKFIEAPGAGWTDNLFQVQTLCLAKKINFTNNAYYHYRRQTANPSEEIKDYVIPFARSEEIFQWLHESNVIDVGILAHIYKRTINYIHIVARMNKISNLSDCSARTSLLCQKMDPEIIYNNKLFTLKDRLTYLECLKVPTLFYLRSKMKQIFKKCFNFNLIVL